MCGSGGEMGGWKGVSGGCGDGLCGLERRACVLYTLLYRWLGLVRSPGNRDGLWRAERGEVCLSFKGCLGLPLPDIGCVRGSWVSVSPWVLACQAVRDDRLMVHSRMSGPRDALGAVDVNVEM